MFCSILFLQFVCLKLSIGIPFQEVFDYENIVSELYDHAQNYKRPENHNYFFENTTDRIFDYGRYDFVVIGAGSAGAIVAKRLSQQNYTTLLLEAGELPQKADEIPEMWPILQCTKDNWGYLTIPQNYSCQAMKNHQCNFPRGKCLGGSSSTNALAYARGNQMDQILWYQLGNNGWSFNDTLKYFRKMENYQIDIDPLCHGQSGSISQGYSHPPSPMLNTFIQAHRDCGMEYTEYNGDIQIGVSRTQYTMRGRRRDSTYTGYLVDTNEYLTILTEAFAYKLNFFAKKWATSVNFVRRGLRYNVKANREIILSAGTINSAQLLLLSGIGPKEELEALSVPFIRDLPVGKNMEDHTMFIGLRVKTDQRMYHPNLTLDAEQYVQYYGPLTNPMISGISYIQTKPNIYKDYPNIEILLGEDSTRPAVCNLFNFDDDARQAYDLPEDVLEHIVAPSIILLHPKSRGSVKLRSADPKDFPLIDPNSLADEEDLEALYNGTQFMLKLLETPSYQMINAGLLKIVLPQCSHYEYLSKDYWYCTIRHMSHTIYHATGTCRMGPINDQNTVVNDRLQVHGMRRLRVADASVIPLATSGHTNGPAMMIGEKAADMIIEDNGADDIWSQLQRALIFAD